VLSQGWFSLRLTKAKLQQLGKGAVGQVIQCRSGWVAKVISRLRTEQDESEEEDEQEEDEDEGEDDDEDEDEDGEEGEADDDDAAGDDDDDDEEADDNADDAMGRAARPRERRAPAAFQPGGAANRLSADAVADASGQQEADDDSADDRTACELASQPKSAYVPALFDPLPLFDPDAAQSREARAAERQQRLAPEAEEEQASDSSSSSSSSTEESSSDELPAEKSMGASGSCGREWYSALGYSRVVLEDPCCAFLK